MTEQLSLFGPGPPPPRPLRRRLNPHTLFYAIFPPPGPAAQITRQRQGLGAELGWRGGEVATDRLHITLYPIWGGDEPPPPWLVEAAREAAGLIAAAPFEIVFDRVASFTPIVLLPRESQPLTALHGALGAALAKVGLPIRRTSRFAPHISLLYGQRRIEERAVDPVTWTVRAFTLVHSLVGQTRHVRLGQWTLRG